MGLKKIIKAFTPATFRKIEKSQKIVSDQICELREEVNNLQNLVSNTLYPMQKPNLLHNFVY